MVRAVGPARLALELCRHAGDQLATCLAQADLVAFSEERTKPHRDRILVRRAGKDLPQGGRQSVERRQFLRPIDGMAPERLVAAHAAPAFGGAARAAFAIASRRAASAGAAICRNVGESPASASTIAAPGAGPIDTEKVRIAP